jgi:hypothetical protein
MSTAHQLRMDAPIRLTIQLKKSSVEILLLVTFEMQEASLKGLQNFGSWMRRTRKDSSYWPFELRKWFREQGFSFEAGDIMTQQRLATWLAEVSGNEEKDLAYRVKTMELWADIDSLKKTRVKGMKLDLGIALGLSGFLSLDDQPVFLDSIWIFDEVLNGKINPLTDKWPTKPIGRGMGKPLGAFLEGVVFSVNKGTLFDLTTRMGFVAGHWSEQDIVQGGWFYDLVHGKIFDLSLADLTRTAKCIQDYLRKYQDKEALVTVDDLIAILSHQRPEQATDTLIEKVRKADSAVATHVIYFCRDHEKDLESFVTEELGIPWERWLALEDGAKPAIVELNSLSFLLGEKREFFEQLWADQYGADS